MRMWACVYRAVDCLLLSLILVSFLVCFVFNIHDYVWWAFLARFHQDTLQYGFFGGKHTVSFSQFSTSKRCFRLGLSSCTAWNIRFLFSCGCYKHLTFHRLLPFFFLFLSMRSLVFEYKIFDVISLILRFLSTKWFGCVSCSQALLFKWNGYLAMTLGNFRWIKLLIHNIFIGRKPLNDWT